METNVICMAFATGKESTESGSVKRFIGVAPVKVLAINPNKTELEKLYNTTIENEPVYMGETEVGLDVNKHKVPQIRLDFIVQTDVEKCNGIEMTTKVSFFLSKEIRYNRDGSKVQVINKYGETTWLPIDNVKEHTVPASLSWFEPADYRPAYIGEEELTGFIKAYLNIPNKSYRNSKTGEVISIANKADAEARLDNIQEYFKGNVKELKDVIALQPNNKVKVLFGVKTTDDNKQYQTVYTQKFLKNNITDYSYLDKDVQDRKANGAYPSTEFKICDLKEYTIEATDFKSTNDSPFDTPVENCPWDL